MQRTTDRIHGDGESGCQGSDVDEVDAYHTLPPRRACQGGRLAGHTPRGYGPVYAYPEEDGPGQPERSWAMSAKGKVQHLFTSAAARSIAACVAVCVLNRLSDGGTAEARRGKTCCP